MSLLYFNIFTDESSRDHFFTLLHVLCRELKCTTVKMMASALAGMDADQLYQWLQAQNLPADVIESFRGNVGRYQFVDRFSNLFPACR